MLADLLHVGDEYTAARGGQGGLGNAALASTKRKSTRLCTPRHSGEETDIVLELNPLPILRLLGTHQPVNLR